MFTFIILFLIAYLVGAVPTGFWVCKYFHGIDITKRGSGNIGATNVARVTGRLLFIPIFLIDTGKAFFTLYFANIVLNKLGYASNLHNMFICCLVFALLLGNAYSVFIGFKGGKGVATSLGVIAFTCSSSVFITYVALWGFILFLTRQVFLASLGAMFFLICILLYFGQCDKATIFMIMSIFIWLIFRHKSNIQECFR